MWAGKPFLKSKLYSLLLLWKVLAGEPLVGWRAFGWLESLWLDSLYIYFSSRLDSLCCFSFILVFAIQCLLKSLSSHHILWAILSGGTFLMQIAEFIIVCGQCWLESF
jgi:hypothetical protein